jgi:hypothetical protein
MECEVKEKGTVSRSMQIHKALRPGWINFANACILPSRRVRLVISTCGEMAEWLKAHAWKACLGETLTRVRIPLSPPYIRTTVAGTRLAVYTFKSLCCWCRSPYHAFIRSKPDSYPSEVDIQRALHRSRRTGEDALLLARKTSSENKLVNAK